MNRALPPGGSIRGRTPALTPGAQPLLIPGGLKIVPPGVVLGEGGLFQITPPSQSPSSTFQIHTGHEVDLGSGQLPVSLSPFDSWLFSLAEANADLARQVVRMIRGEGLREFTELDPETAAEMQERLAEFYALRHEEVLALGQIERDPAIVRLVDAIKDEGHSNIPDLLLYDAVYSVLTGVSPSSLLPRALLRAGPSGTRYDQLLKTAIVRAQSNFPGEMQEARDTLKTNPYTGEELGNPVALYHFGQILAAIRDGMPIIKMPSELQVLRVIMLANILTTDGHITSYSDAMRMIREWKSDRPSRSLSDRIIQTVIETLNLYGLSQSAREIREEVRARLEAYGSPNQRPPFFDAFMSILDPKVREELTELERDLLYGILETGAPLSMIPRDYPLRGDLINYMRRIVSIADELFHDQMEAVHNMRITENPFTGQRFDGSLERIYGFARMILRIRMGLSPYGRPSEKWQESVINLAGSLAGKKTENFSEAVDAIQLVVNQNRNPERILRVMRDKPLEARMLLADAYFYGHRKEIVFRNYRTAIKVARLFASLGTYREITVEAEFTDDGTIVYILRQNGTGIYPRDKFLEHIDDVVVMRVPPEAVTLVSEDDVRLDAVTTPRRDSQRIDFSQILTAVDDLLYFTEHVDATDSRGRHLFSFDPDSNSYSFYIADRNGLVRIDLFIGRTFTPSSRESYFTADEAVPTIDLVTITFSDNPDVVGPPSRDYVSMLERAIAEHFGYNVRVTTGREDLDEMANDFRLE